MVAARQLVTGVNGHDSWQWKEITLTRGDKIRVRAIPPHLSAAAMASIPLPKPPLVEIKVANAIPTKAVERRENPDDPDYLREYAEALDKRGQLILTFQYSWGVDCHVPEDASWKSDLEEAIPSITWADGANGYKADYVRYVLLQYPDDLDKVQKALGGEEPIKKEEVDAVVDSFRD